ENGDRTYADIVANVSGRSATSLGGNGNGLAGGNRSPSPRSPSSRTHTSRTHASKTLAPLLRTLVEGHRVLTTDHPLSERPGKPMQYRVVDTGIRFYLAALRDACELVRQGRPDSANRLVRRRWTTWRERAVQPLVREALARAATTGRLPWPEATSVGGWWNQWLNPEVSLVGADRAPVARQVYFAGAIKWLDSPFDSRDLAGLHESALAVPGFVPG
nr:hypothetical protein [Micromonospora sp. DSM 115978]